MQANSYINTESSLKSYNTFGIDARVKSLNFLKQPQQIDSILEEIMNSAIIPIFLGGGSNVLFIDEIVQQPIVINQLEGIELLHETNTEVIINVLGGTNWHSLVEYTIRKGWYGLENMALIPGSVGASPIQNIGAYGVELKDVFLSCDAISLKDGEVKTYDLTSCDFGYRSSFFKNHRGEYFIKSVQLKLNKKVEVNLSYGALKAYFEAQNQKQITPVDVFNAVISIRTSKLPDPNEIGNAGSFFKNPVIDLAKYESLKENYPNIPSFDADIDSKKIPAAWFIDQCGWKGKKIGNVGAYKHQPLVLVNHGGATGIEVWNLAQEIIKTVEDRFGITLKPEVNVIGAGGYINEI